MSNQRHVVGWKAILQSILNEWNDFKGKGRDGRTVSHKTRNDRAKCLFLCFHVLREKLGFRIEDPNNLKPKHVEALVKYWEQRHLSAATIQTRLSFLRAFSHWIGKPGMIGPSVSYVENPESVKRDYGAREDKGWTANGIDVAEVLRAIMVEAPHVGMQLKMAFVFGLRRKEAVMFAPFLADQGDIMIVDRGTKGGRPRFVSVNTPIRRAVLDEAKEFVLIHSGSRLGHIGEPGKTLEQNLTRYSYVLTRHGITKKECGTTGHGLRHQFACDHLELGGVVAPVRGGNDTPVEDEDARRLAVLRVSEELGHSRESVIAAYAGRFIRKKTDT